MFTIEGIINGIPYELFDKKVFKTKTKGKYYILIKSVS